MNFDRLSDLIDTVDQSNLSFFSWQEGDFSLELSGPQDLPSFSPDEASFKEGAGEESEKEPGGLSFGEKGLGETVIQIYSPMIGVFISEKDDHSGPLVRAGERVEEGQILCYIEAIQRRDEVRAPKDGLITGIHLANGESVEYGQELYSLKVAGAYDQ